MTLGVPSFLPCGNVRGADELFTEVLDPLNHPVPHTRTEPMTETVPSTQLTFTPVLPGNHHLRARFEPAIGTAQLEVLAVVEHPGPPAKTYALGAQCTALEVMPSGLVLCLTSSDQLRVYRDDGLLQTLDADDFATIGAVVWTTRLGVIQRRVESGGATPLGAELSFDTSLGNPGTLLATASEAVLITREATVRVRLGTGVLLEAARVAIGAGSRGVVQPCAGLDR
ncbi:MAG: hypothetical protein H6Q89_4534, partial [Myxococcaceae bacterium]|nr:hypothetical protein [Myxococcaceae bacterium]